MKPCIAHYSTFFDDIGIGSYAADSFFNTFNIPPISSTLKTILNVTKLFAITIAHYDLAPFLSTCSVSLAAQ